MLPECETPSAPSGGSPRVLKGDVLTMVRLTIPTGLVPADPRGFELLIGGITRLQNIQEMKEVSSPSLRDSGIPRRVVLGRLSSSDFREGRGVSRRSVQASGRR